MNGHSCLSAPDLDPAPARAAATPVRTPLILLVDHANIPFYRASVPDLIRAWLASLLATARIPDSGLLSMSIRAYGGWYLGESVSDERFQAAEMYQRECPLLLEHAGLYCRIRFEFADSLLGAGAAPARPSTARITHTVGVRTKPPRIWPLSDPSPCTEEDCELPGLRRWLRRRRGCTRLACERDFADCFRRLEQRQVDVHLATDLLTVIMRRPGPVHLAVASDDTDLLPAILSAGSSRESVSSVTTLRFDTGQTYLDAQLAAADVEVVRIARAGEVT